MIQLYDTLTRKKKNLPDQKKIRLFVCGPTVYDYAHIGHARTYIFFDFFANYLRAQGYDVFYLQNITDVDDKIIKRAAEENKKPEEIARFFTETYLEDMKALGIQMTPDEDEKSDKILYAPATKFITQIVAQVQRLIDKGYAYKIDGDGWYFDISKFPDYGKLSGRTALQAEDAVSRIDESVGKKNKGDFCLWKFSKPGEPVWTVAIGNGRPGWHIEDTSISEFYFGPQYDIHGGGVDLKFPHHEAEIAQQESASGKKPFVKLWMHTGALLVDGKKMSKSLGNFITIRDFLKKYDADMLRWITLTHHYRSPIDYSEQVAQQAQTAIDGIKKFLAKLGFWSKKNQEKSDVDVKPVIGGMDKKLEEALADDIHVETAIAGLFGAISELQRKEVWNLAPAAAEALKKGFHEKLKLFGFSLVLPKIPRNIEELAAERELSRASKQFEQSDRLRKEINGLGYDIEDTPQGPFLWPTPKKHN